MKKLLKITPLSCVHRTVFQIKFGKFTRKLQCSQTNDDVARLNVWDGLIDCMKEMIIG